MKIYCERAKAVDDEKRLSGVKVGQGAGERRNGGVSGVTDGEEAWGEKKRERESERISGLRNKYKNTYGREGGRCKQQSATSASPKVLLLSYLVG